MSAQSLGMSGGLAVGLLLPSFDAGAGSQRFPRSLTSFMCAGTIDALRIEHRKEGTMHLALSRGAGYSCAALAVAGFVVSGCAARSKAVTLQPLTADMSHYKTVVISVESRVPGDVTKEKADLEGLTVSRVKALNRFSSVQLKTGDMPPTPETLVVNVGITHLKKVGGTKRFMLGAAAGRASMTTEITLVDATGKTLGSYTVIGQSGGSGLAGGTSEAVTKTAEAVAGLLGGGAAR
jgi:hypothetical protein